MFHRHRDIHIAALLALGATVAACSTDSTGPLTPQFKIDSGAVTLAAPGQRIRYVIQLLTTGGQPMPGEPITASVVRGSGQLGTPAVQLTDSTGRLRIQWQLGLEPDTQAIQLTLETGTASTIKVPVGTPLHAEFAAGSRAYGCGQDSAGFLYCWSDFSGAGGARAAVLAGAPRFQLATPSIAAAAFSDRQFTSCAIDADFQLWCWGSNREGRLGRGSTLDQSETPAPVAGNNRYRQVSVGGSTVCAVTVDSAGFCWGYGREGQLGNGDTASSTVPQAVAGGLHFAQVITSFRPFACGLTATGEVYCWGRSGFSPGSFGSLPDSNYTTPVLVQSGFGFAELASDGNVICGRTALGAVSCWGDNYAGGIGDPGAPASSQVPIPVVGGHRFASISPALIMDGGFYALETTGQLFAWGGFNTGSSCYTDTRTQAPVAVAEALRFLQVSSAAGDYCGTVGDGTVYCGSACFGPPAAMLPPAP